MRKRDLQPSMQFDKSIDFIAIANNMGTLIAYSLREGLVPLLNEEELSEQYNENCPSHENKGRL